MKYIILNRDKKREPIFRLIPFVLKRRLPTLPLLRSTIGVTRLNFSVRNGKRWIPRAIATLMPFYLLSLTGQPPEFLQNNSLLKNYPTLLRKRKSRAISTTRLCHCWLYTCSLSTSSSLTTLTEILSIVGWSIISVYIFLASTKIDVFAQCTILSQPIKWWTDYERSN